MKLFAIFFFSLFIHQGTFSADTTYYVILRSNILRTDTAYSYKNFQHLNHCCERILNSDIHNWLLMYYAAYANVQMSFISNENERKDMHCNQAEKYIRNAFNVPSDESELYVLEALLYFARIEVNPKVRGPQYYPKAKQALENAKLKNSNNPRIYFLEAKSIMNMPEFMGGGKKNALPVIEKSLYLYETYLPENSLFPHWGEYNTRILYEECIERE